MYIYTMIPKSLILTLDQSKRRSFPSFLPFVKTHRETAYFTLVLLFRRRRRPVTTSSDDCNRTSNGGLNHVSFWTTRSVKRATNPPRLS